MKSTLIYGHRGARGERPENTIEGFRYAKSCNVAGIETDIAMSADLIPVLHHNAALPDGRLICDLPITKINHIVTLAEALREIPNTNWLLEIKTYPDAPSHSHPAVLVVKQVLAVIEAAKIPLSRLHILAFDWQVLRAVKALNPALSRVCLTAPKTEAARALWWGTITDNIVQAVASSGANGWAAFAGTLTAPQIAEAKSHGLQVFVWTVNDPAQFSTFAPLVDGLMTDYPSRFTSQHPSPPKN